MQLVMLVQMVGSSTNMLPPVKQRRSEREALSFVLSCACFRGKAGFVLFRNKEAKSSGDL